MSHTPSPEAAPSTTETTIDQLVTLVHDQQSTIADLEATVSDQAELIETQQQRLETLCERVSELENDSTPADAPQPVELADRLETLERTVTIKHDRHLSWLDQLIVGDESGYLTDDQEALLAEHDSLIDALDTSTQSGEPTDSDTTRLRRVVDAIAEKVDLDTSSPLGGATEDTLTRLLKHGPSDITDRVYAVHHRARDVLSHIGDWGTTTNDAYGRRITISAPVVKEKLSLKRDEQLSSTEVRRIFEKLEALAADSPRDVTADTGGRSQNRLMIALSES
ncbi:hypothetical protein [Halobaculum magnesiiphilum]|uniref:Uncharacterized protein n=1 Tax=Halobaculum magnesiiphilum TaxID=1017351 RepID=A0A8T8WEV7_9EURY|nr:hypothetical protein [Halobaculum magnesiiphilum]QZP38263.1 hypothetical protein K6T50_03660 [Halobaculum magnesiiphilum]